MTGGPLGPFQVDPGRPAVFKDDNPDATADGRYKAFFRSVQPNGLPPLQSADGLRWSPMSDAPVITEGALDSRNLTFWGPTLGKYRAYRRYFTPRDAGQGPRAIRTAASTDLLHWPDSVDLTCLDSPPEELYTN